MTDLFGHGQLGLGLEDTRPKPSYEPDRDEVRSELMEVLAAARAATTHSPWDLRTFQYHKTVFPQMANWLPVEERDQLRFEFARHVERIELMMAA